MKRILILVLALVLLLTLAVTPVMAAKGPKAAVWHVPGDFATIQEAIYSDDVAAGDTVIVGPGSHCGAYVDKAVHIKGTDGTVISDGPQYGGPDWIGFKTGFLLDSSSSGATISGFTFECGTITAYADQELVFPIFSRGANSVTINHNVMTNSLQAITNWYGSDWNIHHNVTDGLVTFNGGGIGIFIGDLTGGTVANNVISNNKIAGTLQVFEGDGGGYCGSGIVLFADFRYGRAGAEEIKDNRVVHNKVSMVSDTPDVVDIVAFELTDTREDAAELDPVLFDNAIGFNDFRGTVLQIALTPDNLDEHNDISRNLGDNRGHGLHPSVFK